ncbi:cytochrome c oxidase assembly [Micractinium conductrix]|uniref:Cytochrome c oxidase assembly n=1 Tax=Micractinium conductrix TaxID=554055 RepID=A0A2P6V5S2_9CHLO|nr:cytochrome c oxidase assembly [Micractinium conductrix]|eukprot:PSC69439.1 cytochrome c oxidase assembly [Micractinium conductrix]
MGAGQSRQGLDDDFFLDSGVRVTQGLLEQLDGKPRPSRPAPGGGLPFAGSAAAQGLRPPTQQAELSDAALAAGDASLAAALQRSRRVGGLLLRHEEAELAAANQLADELVAREFAAPSRPHPCSQQADDCVRCYTEHASDSLACAAAVEAYGACAKAAWQEALSRNAAAP